MGSSLTTVHKNFPWSMGDDHPNHDHTTDTSLFLGGGMLLNYKYRQICGDPLRGQTLTLWKCFLLRCLQGLRESKTVAAPLAHNAASRKRRRSAPLALRTEFIPSGLSARGPRIQRFNDSYRKIQKREDFLYVSSSCEAELFCFFSSGFRLLLSSCTTLLKS